MGYLSCSAGCTHFARTNKYSWLQIHTSLYDVSHDCIVGNMEYRLHGQYGYGQYGWYKINMETATLSA